MWVTGAGRQCPRKSPPILDTTAQYGAVPLFISSYNSMVINKGTHYCTRLYFEPSTPYSPPCHFTIAIIAPSLYSFLHLLIISICAFVEGALIRSVLFKTMCQSYTLLCNNQACTVREQYLVTLCRLGIVHLQTPMRCGCTVLYLRPLKPPAISFLETGLGRGPPLFFKRRARSARNKWSNPRPLSCHCSLLPRVRTVGRRAIYNILSHIYFAPSFIWCLLSLMSYKRAIFFPL